MDVAPANPAASVLKRAVTTQPPSIVIIYRTIIHISIHSLIKDLLLVGITFFVISVTAMAQDVSLRIIDNNVPIEGVNVLVNGSGYAATDSAGIVYMKGLSDGDEIVLSHVLYSNETLIWPFQDTCVVLHSAVFVLDTGMVRAKDDRDFLKSVFKQGLHLGSTTNYISVHTSDTLSGVEYEHPSYFSTRAKAKFILSNRIPYVSILSVENKLKLSKKIVNHYTDLIKVNIPHATGNGMFFATQFLRRKWPDNVYVEYLGKQDEEYVFKFYWTPDSNGKAKGLLFIGIHDGILHRVCVSQTQWKPFSGYVVTILFHYLEQQNSILPSEVHYKRSFFDSNHNVDTQHFFNFYYEWD